MTIKLIEILSDLDFDYKINKDNTLSLIDLQGANLGNIESESFLLDSIAMSLIDRLEIYIDDFYINGYIDTLNHECCENLNCYSYSAILEKMQKYPDIFGEGCIELMKAFINPELVDVSDIIENSKIVLKCHRCGTRLKKSGLPDYKYFCQKCQEDFLSYGQ